MKGAVGACEDPQRIISPYLGDARGMKALVITSRSPFHRAPFQRTSRLSLDASRRGRSRLERLPNGSTRRTERKSESGGRAVDGAPIDSRTNSSGIEMAACAHRRPPPAAPNAHRDAPRARATSATPQPARRAAEVGEIAAFRATAAESAAAATRAAQAAVVATRTRAASPAKDTCARHRCEGCCSNWQMRSMRCGHLVALGA